MITVRFKPDQQAPLIASESFKVSEVIDCNIVWVCRKHQSGLCNGTMYRLDEESAAGEEHGMLLARHTWCSWKFLVDGNTNSGREDDA